MAINIKNNASQHHPLLDLVSIRIYKKSVTKISIQSIICAFLGFYAVSTLLFQAGMSIGGLLLLCLAIVLVLQSLLGDRAFFNFWLESKFKLLRHPLSRFYWITVVLFIFSMVMSWVMYRHSPIEFNGVPLHYSLGSQISKLWFFILPGVVAIFWSAITGEQRSQLKKIYLWVYAALLVLGTVQIFTGFPRGQPNPNWPGIYHPILLLGHHLSVASIFIFPFFIFIDQWLDEWLMGDQISGKTTGKRTFSKQLSILLLILQLVQFFFLFSRTLWVALPIGLLIWFIVRFKEIQSSQLCKKWGVIAALIFIPSLGLVGFGYQHLHERLTTQAGVSERQFLWNFNFNLFKQRPLFGIGFGGNEDAAHFYVREVLHQKPGSDIFVGHAHQLFLQLLAGTGIFGFTVFLLMVISLLRLAYFTTPVLIAPWCVLILNGMTQVNWFEGKVFHQISLMTGMMLGNVLISMTQTTQRRIQ